MPHHLVALVVGEGQNGRVSAARYLKSRGFVVCEARDALSALSLLAKIRTSAVLVDGDHLSDADTSALFAGLALYPATALVVLTSKAESFAPGGIAHSVLRKPCEPALVLATLRLLCEQSVRAALRCV